MPQHQQIIEWFCAPEKDNHEVGCEHLVWSVTALRKALIGHKIYEDFLIKKLGYLPKFGLKPDNGKV